MEFLPENGPTDQRDSYRVSRVGPIALKAAIGSESAIRVVCASLAGAAPELLLFFSSSQAQLLDCCGHAVTSILRIAFQKIVRLER
jgi:hypothetical protein